MQVTGTFFTALASFAHAHTIPVVYNNHLTRTSITALRNYFPYLKITKQAKR